ncbi:hypothetical protein K502DRAFT_261956 [Neoconidiobolus thromboides FSU 785]|nr:hypothetical protein K502DRAFT_261956 [Neoconidiobolus thromboides FSU 785]
MNSPTESQIDAEEERWDDWESDEDIKKCLFCEMEEVSITKLFEHFKQEHGFDFLKLKKEKNLDFYNSLKLFNFLREKQVNNEVFELGNLDWGVIQDEKYLIPAMDDDALLYEFEDILEDSDDTGNEAEVDNETAQEKEINRLKKEVEELKRQLGEKEEQFEQFRNFVKDQFLIPLKKEIANVTL